MCFHPVRLQVKQASLLSVARPLWIPGKGYCIEVPCGKCVECRESNARQLAARLHAERLDSTDSFMVTLTYNNGNLPPIGVNKQDFDKFFNRLRQSMFREYGERVKLRYYYVGEYGYRRQRPHYHAIVFVHGRYIGVRDFYSFVEKTWQKGFVNVKLAVNRSTEDYLEDRGFINDDKGFNYITRYVTFGDYSRTPKLQGMMLPEPNPMDKKYWSPMTDSEFAAFEARLNQKMPRFATRSAVRNISLDKITMSYPFGKNGKVNYLLKAIMPYLTPKEKREVRKFMADNAFEYDEVYDTTIRFHYRKFKKDYTQYLLQKQNPPFYRCSKGLGISLFTKKKWQDYFLKAQNTFIGVLSKGEILKYPIPRYIWRKYVSVYDSKTNLIDYENGKRVSNSYTQREYLSLLEQNSVLTSTSRYSSSLLSLCKKRSLEFRQSQCGVYTELSTRFVNWLSLQYESSEKSVVSLFSRLRLSLSQYYDQTRFRGAVSHITSFLCKLVLGQIGQPRNGIAQGLRRACEKIFGFEITYNKLYDYLCENTRRILDEAQASAQIEKEQKYLSSYIHCKSHKMEMEYV